MIDFSKPPKFEKHNHHFVPRFWQKHFCGPGGRLFKTKRGRYVQASLADTMTSDWTYLAFDEGWRPTDEVEDQLSQWEGLASKLIVRSLPTQTVLSDDDWGSLCVWLGLATSRHPNVLNRYKPLASAFTLELATAHDYSDLDAFNEHLQGKFGVGIDEESFRYLLASPQETILATAEHAEAMSPFDPMLPQTDALLARFPVAQCIYEMDLRLVDVPTGSEFILGSNPLPNEGLSFGFSVPLSKDVALLCTPPKNADEPARLRSVATPQEVEQVNLEQIARSEEAIASSPTILKYWAEKFDSL
ncbi:DUF4238 domain-containing protein (plasmid) [Ensifer adhaerens]|uniref:DUF4238 domain-containing protein n=1 Tax=Ensifer adhaerens TaxID=106592 RepID=UPI001CBD4F09|nr:DUF4238 domain-containing protein [Ensifer adhaerens]MBZ7927083.1 DUF4238 domain-containing protein [Ensifer adhaerens]UAX98128.1 DUF4238 domain-containing protein [Ensifer adhaerens]UAY05509.1 DUF4238 domain-containing protein [Ensifer adhaerens]UAY12887.1 DUF4238 domain-containing protein [Ensifer adhaerens]